MTQEERTLLFIDLSERIPYDTVLKVKGLVTSNEEYGDAHLETVSWYEEVSVRDGSRVSYDIADVRPYLRPMSSMTKDEKSYYEDRWFEGYHTRVSPDTVFENEIPSYIDWLKSNHFDYRGLIPKGLAETAPEGMYNN